VGTTGFAARRGAQGRVPSGSSEWMHTHAHCSRIICSMPAMGQETAQSNRYSNVICRWFEIPH